MKSPVRILLLGANGRMGQAIAAEAKSEQAKVQITHRCLRGDPIDDRLTDVDVVVDVSHADVTDALCAASTKHRTPIVIGTTGHSAAQRKTIENAARSTAIVLASNFSVGVNVLCALTRRAAQLLGDGFDREIIEKHHTMKKDAPSGTAKTLAEILRGESPGGGKEIPIQSIREGNIVGDHTVIFTGPGERLELTHHAESRAIFARGALRAAEWIAGKPAGFYSMHDVLGV